MYTYTICNFYSLNIFFCFILINIIFFTKKRLIYVKFCQKTKNFYDSKWGWQLCTQCRENWIEFCDVNFHHSLTLWAYFVALILFSIQFWERQCARNGITYQAVLLALFSSASGFCTNLYLFTSKRASGNIYIPRTDMLIVYTTFFAVSEIVERKCN